MFLKSSEFAPSRVNFMSERSMPSEPTARINLAGVQVVVSHNFVDKFEGKR